MVSIYEGGPVPELVTHITGLEQDFVQLCSLDMLTETCISVVAHYRCIYNACFDLAFCSLGDLLACRAHCVARLAIS